MRKIKISFIISLTVILTQLSSLTFASPHWMRLGRSLEQSFLRRANLFKVQTAERIVRPFSKRACDPSRFSGLWPLESMHISTRAVLAVGGLVSGVGFYQMFKDREEGVESSFFGLSVFALETSRFSEVRIREKLREVDARLSEYEPVEQITVLLGKTEAGKSTVFDHLQGHTLKVVDDPEKGLVIKSSNEDSGIVHGCASGTKYPQLSRDGRVFDCPGFSDAAGAEQDIVNAYSLYSLFRRYREKEFRFALVATDSHLFDDRGNGFVSLLDQVEDLFYGESGSIKNMVSLIVNKSTHSSDKVKLRLRNLIAEHPDLSPFKREMIKFLIQNFDS